MNILGISAYYHDSAACLVQDGRIIAAAQEERFSRIKHDPAFPVKAVEFCLAKAGISAKDLDFLAFYDKPLKTFDRLLETYLAFAPAGFTSFIKAIPVWLKEKLHLPKLISEQVAGDYTMLFLEHHESHAASAFFPSAFEEAAILTADGVGEWTTASWGTGKGNRIQLQEEVHFPHSLGLLYSAFTYFTGFKVNSGEYKLMGLAPYGHPKYAQAIKDHLIEIFDDGSFRLNMTYFNYCQGLTMTSPRFDQLFDGPPRKPEAKLTQREMDLAASVQAVTEEVMLKLAHHIHRSTGMKNLCMAGGVALNCVANGKILREGPFDRIFIQPAAGDAGGALGAALYTWHQYADNPRQVESGRRDMQRGSLLGPQFSNDEIKSFLNARDAVYRELDEAALFDALVALLQQGKVVGLFQGAMEFGPRALGNRSIIADPRNREMQSQLNLKIKFRESFRPFAPIVLEEKCAQYFDIASESPYMLLVADVVEGLRKAMTDAERALFGIEKLNVPRSSIPAVTHVDYSARLQTVDSQRNPRLHRLMVRWEAATGCAVLVNTSFNVRGEPIVCTPADAFNCFMATQMDVLAMENCLLVKEDQHTTVDRDTYLAAFTLD